MWYLGARGKWTLDHLSMLEAMQCWNSTLGEAGDIIAHIYPYHRT